MTVFLDLRAELKEELWAHLLRNDTEQVAIIFAAVEGKDATTVFIARDAYFATCDDFEIQSEFHVELTDEARARIIKTAWDTGASPVEFHSHPHDYWGANFSPSDMYGFGDYVPHCRWRLHGQAYLAVVVTPVGIDALAWTGADVKPAALDAIRLTGGAIIKPTNHTIKSLNTEESKHGPGAF